MTVQVHVLKEGTIERTDDGTIVDASSSVTLVQAHHRNILVDTAMRRDAQEVLDALARHDVEPGSVDMVVNTHGHHDHTGCNCLFEVAEFIIHRLEGAARGACGPVRRVEGGTELVPGVRVIETPGHTRGSISVVAETPEGTWVMAGDALPTLDNYVAWLPPGIHFDPDVALASMRVIVEVADVVVPGHGAPFRTEGDAPYTVMDHLY